MQMLYILKTREIIELKKGRAISNQLVLFLPSFLLGQLGISLSVTLSQEEKYCLIRIYFERVFILVSFSCFVFITDPLE